MDYKGTKDLVPQEIWGFGIFGNFLEFSGIFKFGVLQMKKILEFSKLSKLLPEMVKNKNLVSCELIGTI